jgi:hypothetical protein
MAKSSVPKARGTRTRSDVDIKVTATTKGTRQS